MFSMFLAIPYEDRRCILVYIQAIPSLLCISYRTKNASKASSFPKDILYPLFVPVIRIKDKCLYATHAEKRNTLKTDHLLLQKKFFASYTNLPRNVPFIQTGFCAPRNPASLNHFFSKALFESLAASNMPSVLN